MVKTINNYKLALNNQIEDEREFLIMLETNISGKIPLKFPREIINKRLQYLNTLL